jgi:phage terminase Nu1 subunit (DNA packaging protein)
LIECVSRYVTYQREGNGGDRMKQAGEFSQARAEWMRSKAHRAQLDEQARNQELLPASAMDEAWQAIGSVLRQRYLSVPSKLAAQHTILDTPQKLFECAMSLINDALEELEKFDAGSLDIFKAAPDEQAAE